MGIIRATFSLAYVEGLCLLKEIFSEKNFSLGLRTFANLTLSVFSEKSPSKDNALQGTMGTSIYAEGPLTNLG